MINLDELLPQGFKLDPKRAIEVTDHPRGGTTTAWPQADSTVRVYVGQFPDAKAARDFLDEAAKG